MDQNDWTNEEGLSIILDNFIWLLPYKSIKFEILPINFNLNRAGYK